MMILGITGPTGSGKTTLLQQIADRGGIVLDLDAVYHELLRTSDDLRSALAARFPGVIVDGMLCRKALGNIVFADKAALADLNEITGRFIQAETDRQLRAAREKGIPHAAIDAINLLESPLPQQCNYTIAVTAPVETRVQRLMVRDNISEEYARLRISAQPDNEYYESRCTFSLRNDGSREEFFKKCTELLDRLLGEGKDLSL